jgi:DnaJ-class molecular chaperone
MNPKLRNGKRFRIDFKSVPSYQKSHGHVCKILQGKTGMAIAYREEHRGWEVQLDEKISYDFQSGPRVVKGRLYATEDILIIEGDCCTKCKGSGNEGFISTVRCSQCNGTGKY